MQSVSSRIWTRVAVSISYDDNDYTTGIFVGPQIREVRKDTDFEEQRCSHCILLPQPTGQTRKLHSFTKMNFWSEA